MSRLPELSQDLYLAPATDGTPAEQHTKEKKYLYRNLQKDSDVQSPVSSTGATAIGSKHPVVFTLKDTKRPPTPPPNLIYVIDGYLIDKPILLDPCPFEPETADKTKPPDTTNGPVVRNGILYTGMEPAHREQVQVTSKSAAQPQVRTLSRTRPLSAHEPTLIQPTHTQPTSTIAQNDASTSVHTPIPGLRAAVHNLAHPQLVKPSNPHRSGLKKGDMGPPAVPKHAKGKAQAETSSTSLQPDNSSMNPRKQRLHRLLNSLVTSLTTLEVNEESLVDLLNEMRGLGVEVPRLDDPVWDAKMMERRKIKERMLALQEEIQPSKKPPSKPEASTQTELEMVDEKTWDCGCPVRWGHLVEKHPEMLKANPGQPTKEKAVRSGTAKLKPDPRPEQRILNRLLEANPLLGQNLLSLLFAWRRTVTQVHAGGGIIGTSQPKATYLEPSEYWIDGKEPEGWPVGGGQQDLVLFWTLFNKLAGQIEAGFLPVGAPEGGEKEREGGWEPTDERVKGWVHKFAKAAYDCYPERFPRPKPSPSLSREPSTYSQYGSQYGSQLSASSSMTLIPQKESTLLPPAPDNVDDAEESDTDSLTASRAHTRTPPPVNLSLAPHQQNDEWRRRKDEWQYCDKVECGWPHMHRVSDHTTNVGAPPELVRTRKRTREESGETQAADSMNGRKRARLDSVQTDDMENKASGHPLVVHKRPERIGLATVPEDPDEDLPSTSQPSPSNQLPVNDEIPPQHISEPAEVLHQPPSIEIPPIPLEPSQWTEEGPPKKPKPPFAPRQRVTHVINVTNLGRNFAHQQQPKRHNPT